MISLKKIAAVCFVFAFLMGAFLFLRIQLLPFSTTKILFFFSGILAFTFNLLAFKTEKSNESFNLLYWIGAIFLFVGLFFKLNYWPYSLPVLIGGSILTGISFFYSPRFKKRDSEADDELIDKL